MAGSNLFMTAFQVSNDPGLIFLNNAPSFIITSVNDAFIKATGTTPEQFLNKGVAEAFEALPATQQFFKGTELISTLTSFESGDRSTGWRVLFCDSEAQNGQGVCWEFKIIPLKEEGVTPAYLLTGTDITSKLDLEKLMHLAMQPHSAHKTPVALIQNALEEKNTILENIGDGFFRLDKDWIVTYWNNQAEKIFDRPRQEVLNKSLWDSYPDAVDSPFYTNYHKAVSEHRIMRFELEYIPRDVWLEVSAFPSSDGLSVYFKDITARKKAEQYLSDSEEKSRMIMNASLDAIICMDDAGDVIFWNPKATAIFGWRPEQVMGRRLSEFIIPEFYRHYHDAGMARYRETGKSNTLNRLLELHAVKRNGEQFPIELTIIPIRQQHVQFFCAFIRDISARKQAEESIKLSNERFEKVSQATNDAIWDWDITRDMLYRGTGFGTLFGFEEKNLTKHANFWKEKFHPEDVPALESSLMDAIDQPGTSHWKMEYRIIKPGGEVAVVIDRGIIMRDESGKAIRMVGAMTDITYHKEYEASLKRLNETLAEHAKDLATSNKELEQFAYVASHDLQEPLRMVTSFLTQLENRYKDVLDDKGRQYIHYAVDGAKRMRQIILDLLEFSRVGKWEDRVAYVDTNKIIADTVRLYKKRIDDAGAGISTKNLPIVHTYVTPLTQVFQNLISNALKYCRAGVPPIIEITCEQRETDWLFAIKDNGIGIHPDNFDRIFLMFQRLHSKSEYSGSGIGLSIVKKIIVNLGGSIWVESPGEVGIIFCFTLPANEVSVSLTTKTLQDV